MTQLEQQASEILEVMYDSVTKQNFDSISDDVDRVSDAVDSDTDRVDTDSIKSPCDNDNNITTGSTKHERNMTDILKDTDTKDKVPIDTPLSIIRKHIPRQSDIDKIVRNIETHVIHSLELPIQAQDLVKAYQHSTRFCDIY